MSPDSSVNVSSPVSFDSPVNGADMEEMVRLLVFPVGMMISRIHLVLILSLTLIKIVVINSVVLKKVVLILNKVLRILNKVFMWNKVRVR